MDAWDSGEPGRSIPNNPGATGSPTEAQGTAKVTIRSRAGVFLPLGSILDRYLIWAHLTIFLASLSIAAGFYLIVDFFDRIDNFLDAGASWNTALEYYLYKLPLVISHVFGAAALLTTLFFVGMLARRQEITAMRSSGLSLRRISLPLLFLSLCIGILNFFWNEGLVPIFARKSHSIYNTVVRKQDSQSVLGTKDIWIRGNGAFIHVRRFDRRRIVLEGVSIFILNQNFSLRGFAEVPRARWDGQHWEAQGGTEWLFLPDGKMAQRSLHSHLPLEQTPEDFQLLVRELEEFGFLELKRYIEDLRSKGIDTVEYEVDLQVKMALPFIPPLMVFLAIPFALRQGRGGLHVSFVLSILISLGYWCLLAFSVSLGRTGAFSPWLAAWLPNLTLALSALFFFSIEE